MSDNSSFHHGFHSSFLHSLDCSRSRVSMLILITFSITNMLLILPLCTFVLFLGYQRWQRGHISTTAAAAASHCDIFTYHMVVMEILTAFGCLFYCVGVCTNLPVMMMYSLEIFTSTWCIKIHFHSLTCVERYLAVVHPVTYLSLKNKGGARIRNISIGCVWLLCFAWGVLMALSNNTVNMTVFFCLVVLASLVICFCCISVLCALRRLGPGDRRRDDQMKRRAFGTLVAITGVLLLCLGGMLVGDAQLSLQLSDSGCVVVTSTIWFSLPSSFVLPLLYLHRAGKLPGCKHNSDIG